MPKTDQNSFFQDVYDVVRLVPAGRVTSYGAIARYLSAPRSSRMVGWAMNQAHDFKDIPAHRVVNRIGVLTGKNNFPTPTMMQELLESENVIVKKDQIENFSEIFWDPNKEISL